MSCLIFICVHCFFLKMIKLYKDIYSALNKSSFCRNFSLIDCRHKRLKNTIDALLFYGERFYGFSESGMTRMAGDLANSCQNMLSF